MDNKQKDKTTFCIWALCVSVFANFAVIAVTLWEHARHDGTEIWFSSTFFYTVVGATLVALVVGLPLNIIAFSHFASEEANSKRYLSATGIILSLTPWVMPLLFG